MSDLLPCPFCGKKPTCAHASRFLKCEPCNFTFPGNLYHAPEALWNHRAPSPSPILTYPNSDEARITRKEHAKGCGPGGCSVACNVDAPPPAAGLSEDAASALEAIRGDGSPRGWIHDALTAEFRRLLTPKPLPENVREAMAWAEHPLDRVIDRDRKALRAFHILAAHIRATNGGGE